VVAKGAQFIVTDRVPAFLISNDEKDDKKKDAIVTNYRKSSLHDLRSWKRMSSNFRTIKKNGLPSSDCSTDDLRNFYRINDEDERDHDFPKIR